jgi:uncharacterized protein involved in exopolysaccharide biosynthesis
VEYVVLAETDDTAKSGLQDYLHLFWRRKWLFLLPVMCIIPWLVLSLVTQPRRYSATATVLIEDTNPKILAIPEVLGPERGPDFYSTQYEIIKSRAVAEEVVEKLQLYMPQPTKNTNPTNRGCYTHTVQSVPMATTLPLRFPDSIMSGALHRFL